MPVRVIPSVRKSRIFPGFEIELRRETSDGDRLGSHVLTELTMNDLMELHYTLGHFIDEGQYQE